MTLSGFPLFWLLAALTVALYLCSYHFRGWWEFRHHPGIRQVFWNSFKDWLTEFPWVLLWCCLLWPGLLLLSIGADLEQQKGSKHE